MLTNWIDKYAPSENTSVSFPVELNANGYSTIRNAWKMAMDLVAEHAAKKSYPVNLEMNFRVFKTSTNYLLQ